MIVDHSGARLVVSDNGEPSIDAATLLAEAARFTDELDGIKRLIDKDFPWYPYRTLGNFKTLQRIFDAHPLFALAGTGRRILDIGGADGDLAFFLERLGCPATILDHAPTNYNGLRGARLLRRHLGSRLEIHDVDLDTQFHLPPGKYDLIFFLGILYHLKNPFYALESLAKVTRHMLISTRVAKLSPAGRSMRDLPVAYLLHPTESNNDPTNFWIFTEPGLLRLCDRAGWNVLMHYSLGEKKKSDPARNDRDERLFALLESRAMVTP